jgi:hypothetical protein
MTTYIPAKLADFAIWLANFSVVLTATPANFGLTAPDAVIVDAEWDIFKAAYAISSTPATRTSSTIAATDSARASAEAVVRPYAVLISANPVVTAQHKIDIGVTVRAITRTPVPAPTDAPALSLVSAIPLSATLEYAVPGQIGKSKPAGCTGMDLHRAIGAVGATDPAQCSYVGTMTKSPFTQAFDAGDQGKIVSYFGRFRTRSGPQGVAQLGPWSALLTMHVI